MKMDLNANMLIKFITYIYRVLDLDIFTKYLDRQAWSNSVDPDQMLHSAASDLGLHFLPLI